MKLLPFAPTILEHAAALTGQTPSKAAQSASLMARAHIEAFRRYCPAAVTVGVDVYNIEAEALGCRVRFYDDASVPGIVTHPLTVESDPAQITFSPRLGRIRLIVDAASRVKEAAGAETAVNVGICGPFSILIELLGYEAAVVAFCDDDARAVPLLEAILAFQKRYCEEIAANGLGATVFESWASPPLVSPQFYRAYAAPYERELFAHMARLGMASRPLVIGGDTRETVDDILATGTTLLVSDYNTPLPLYAEKARAKGVTLRANIDPKLVRSGDWEPIQARICEIYAQAETTPKLIIGTGVIPYDTPPEHLLRAKEMANEK